ncbi:MAG: hypothetical protein ACE5NN_01015 [Candidatus Bathyarchaeia archaeon]
MPFGKWKDFDDCVKDFISQGKDEESARRICGYLQAHLGKESFSWVGDVEVHGENLIRGSALHPIKTVHPEEWPGVRIYLEEELQKATHTLAGKPLLLDHLYPIDGVVLGAEYEDGAIEYVAELNDEKILSWIRNGVIEHCSVEYDWSSLEKVDGVAPRGIRFTGLALLKDFEPGDPETTVEVWESIIKKLKETGAKEQGEPQEFIYYQVRDPAAFLEDRFSTVWIDRVNGIQGIYGRLRDDPENPQPMALLFMKASGWDLERIKSWLTDHPQYVRSPQTEPSAVGVQVSSALLSQQKEDIDALRNEIAILAERKKALEKKVKTLEREKADLTKKLGEAVIEPQKQQEDFRQIVLRELKASVFERVPRGWGYGQYEQNRRIKSLIRRLEGKDR